MKPKVMQLWNRLMLRKQFIIETVFDQPKNISQIEHSRHRNCISFMDNLLAGLIAYSFQPKQPSIKTTRLDKKAFIQILGSSNHKFLSPGTATRSIPSDMPNLILRGFMLATMTVYLPTKSSAFIRRFNTRKYLTDFTTNI